MTIAMTSLTLTIRPGRDGGHIVEVSVGSHDTTCVVPIVPGSKAGRHLAGFVAAVRLASERYASAAGRCQDGLPRAPSP